MHGYEEEHIGISRGIGSRGGGGGTLLEGYGYSLEEHIFSFLSTLVYNVCILMHHLLSCLSLVKALVDVLAAVVTDACEDGRDDSWSTNVASTKSPS